jgi:hypothetical protein
VFLPKLILPATEMYSGGNMKHCFQLYILSLTLRFRIQNPLRKLI